MCKAGHSCTPCQSTDASFLQDPSVEDRQAALFNSTCVHASFGDVEFAQVTLRGMLDAYYCDVLCLLQMCTTSKSDLLPAQMP